MQTNSETETAKLTAMTINSLLYVQLVMAKKGKADVCYSCCFQT